MQYLLLMFLLLTTGAYAQESSDPLVRKLNDFLPTYTPFTPPIPPDRYFPDDVGKKIADAIVHSYLQNPAIVEQRARELAEYDAALTAKGERSTGLTLYVLALANTSLDEKDREAADIATLNAPPDTLLAHADELLADEKRNRIGRRFNWVLSTFDVGSLLFGAPRAPDPSSAQGLVSEWGNKEPAPRERKALVLYREFLRRAPEDPRAAGDCKRKWKSLKPAARRRCSKQSCHGRSGIQDERLLGRQFSLPPRAHDRRIGHHRTRWTRTSRGRPPNARGSRPDTTARSFLWCEASGMGA